MDYKRNIIKYYKWIHRGINRKWRNKKEGIHFLFCFVSLLFVVSLFPCWMWLPVWQPRLLVVIIHCWAGIECQCSHVQIWNLHSQPALLWVTAVTENVPVAHPFFPNLSSCSSCFNVPSLAGLLWNMTLAKQLKPGQPSVNPFNHGKLTLPCHVKRWGIGCPMHAPLFPASHFTWLCLLLLR